MSEYYICGMKNMENLPRDLVKGYTIREEIGRGATGCVFLAKNDINNEKAAIKIINPMYSKNKSYVSRLSRESETTTKIDHPNIVKSFGCGCSLGYYYIILEYVPGKPLDYIINKIGKFDERLAASIILDITKGLDCAHQYRIIHRDIKPANILIDDETKIAKITDFGLAKDEVDSSVTLVGTIIGTPCYISPEQARAEAHLDIRTDLYSLGITLYHMVIGEPPFASCNTSLLLTRKIIEEIPDPYLINQDLSPEICSIIRKLCKRERDKRYNTPAEVINDLNKYLKGELFIQEISMETVESDETVVELRREEIKNPVLQNILVDQKLPCATKTLTTGEVLFYEDDKSKNTYILLKGELEVLKAGRRIATINSQGTFIGEMSYILNLPRSATIRAISPTVLFEVSEKDFEKFLKECPDMAYFLAVALANRLYKTDEQLKETQTALQAIRDQYKFIKNELEAY